MSISVHSCKFIAHITKLEMVIKFPAQISVQWKQSFYDNSVKTKFYPISNGVAALNEQINLQVELIFDQQHSEYIKKQTEMIINLVKPSKPQSLKIVGRVAINLANVLNNKQFCEQKSYSLAYCSMKAELQFKIQIIEQVKVQRSLGQIKKDSLNQFYMKNPSKRASIADLKVSQSFKNLYLSQIQFRGSTSHVVNSINQGKTFQNFLQKNRESKQKQLLQSIQQCKRLNNHLKEELNFKQQQFFQRGQQNLKFKQINSKLQKQLESYLQRINLLKKENKSLQEELFQAKSKMDLNIENLYSEEKLRRKKIDQYEENLIKIKFQLQENTNSLAKAKQRQKIWLEKQQNFTYQIGNLVSQNKKLQEQLQSKRYHETNLKETIIKLQQQINVHKLQLINEDTDKKNQIRQLFEHKDKKIADLNDDKQQLLKELQAISILQEQIQRLNTYVQKLEQQKYALTISGQELSEKLLERQNDLMKIKRQCLANNLQLQKGQETFETHELTIKQYQNQIRTKNNQISQLQQQNKIYELQLQNINLKNVQHRKEVSILRQELGKIIQENNKLSRQILNSEQELKTANRIIMENSKQIAYIKDSKNKIQDNKKVFESKFDELYVKYVEIENHYKQLEDQNNHLQDQLNLWSKYELFKNFDSKVINQLIKVLRQKQSNKLEKFIAQIKDIKANNTQQQQIQMKTLTRNLSIAFQKCKTILLQSKLAYQQKMNLISSMKICEDYVSDIKRFVDITHKKS